MTVKNNDVIGYINCDDCGTRASVHQTTRGKGRYLYKRCACGCDQRNGAAVQTRLFNGTQWIGAAPDAPPNLLTTEIQPKTTEKQPEIEPDFEPQITAIKSDSEPKGSMLGLLASVGVGLGVVMLSMAGARR